MCTHHLFGLSLHSSLDQLTRGHVHAQLTRDVQGPVHQHCLAEQKQIARLTEDELS